MGLVILNESQFNDLKEGSIGFRIRYIRELLYKKYGAAFSSRNVAERIKLISFTALSAVERGDTKDPSARLVKALSDDFEVDMVVFFDDYYNNGYKPIKIGQQEDANESDIKKDTDSYKVGVYVYQEDDYGDRRQLYTNWSSQRWNKSLSLQLMSLIIQTMETNDTLLDDSTLSEHLQHPLFKALSHYKERDLNPLAFPWVPKEVREPREEEIYNLSQNHTKQLLERND